MDYHIDIKADPQARRIEELFSPEIVDAIKIGMTLGDNGLAALGGRVALATVGERRYCIVEAFDRVPGSLPAHALGTGAALYSIGSFVADLEDRGSDESHIRFLLDAHLRRRKPKVKRGGRRR